MVNESMFMYQTVYVITHIIFIVLILPIPFVAMLIGGKFGGKFGGNIGLIVGLFSWVYVMPAVYSVVERVNSSAATNFAPIQTKNEECEKFHMLNQATFAVKKNCFDYEQKKEALNTFVMDIHKKCVTNFPNKSDACNFELESNKSRLINHLTASPWEDVNRLILSKHFRDENKAP